MAKKQVKYLSDLTDAQYRLWESIKEDIDREAKYLSTKRFRVTGSGNDLVICAVPRSGILTRSLKAIVNAGLIVPTGNHYREFTLTDFGKAEIAQDAQPTPSADPVRSDAIEVGDYVRISLSADYNDGYHTEQYAWQQGRNIGIVELRHTEWTRTLKVGFHDDGVEYSYFFAEGELERVDIAALSSEKPAPEDDAEDREYQEVLAYRALDNEPKLLAQIETHKQQFAALLTEIDILSVSSSIQVQNTRRYLMERAKDISPEARSLMDSLIERDARIAALEAKLERTVEHARSLDAANVYLREKVKALEATHENPMLAMRQLRLQNRMKEIARDSSSVRNENAALQERVKALENILKPFACLGDVVRLTASEHSKPDYTWYVFNDAEITLADLFNAADALNTNDAQETTHEL
jgi:hypothetical protein